MLTVTEIVDGIRMSKPKSLKEAIGLAKMKDEQLNHQKKTSRLWIQHSPSSTTMTIPNLCLQQRKFDNVPICAQGILFSITLFTLPLMGLDLVLEIH